MHQTDTLFHKKTGAMGFVFGFDVDNHAINTVPKETLIRITKAEDGGIGGKGVWEPATRGYGPGERHAAEHAVPGRRLRQDHRQVLRARASVDRWNSDPSDSFPRSIRPTRPVSRTTRWT